MNINDPIGNHISLTRVQEKKLDLLKIETIRDLLYYIPARYETTQNISEIKDIESNKKVSLSGEIIDTKMRRVVRKRTMITEAKLKTDKGKIKIIWFNQPYITKKFPEGSMVKVSGTVSGEEGKKYIANPFIEMTDIKKESILSPSASKTDSISPVYRATDKASSTWIKGAMKKLLPKLQGIKDPLPKKIIDKYNLPSLYDAFFFIHNPPTENHAIVGRKRLAFDEIFFLQLLRQTDRISRQSQKTWKTTIKKKDIKDFCKRFPFPLTKSQKQSIEEISEDISKDTPMARLLQGDVGSGKTAVAATTMHNVSNSTPENQTFGKLQAAYMAPTEILAKQQYNTIISLFKESPISIGLITSKSCRKFPSKMDEESDTQISKNQLKKWIESGEVSAVVGTHSLIQKEIKFRNLAYVIIDEQHRFGVAQRKNLLRQDSYNPHFLSMTATPIPRTLALTIYGDLDISVLDEMPKDRGKIKTDLIDDANKKDAYKRLKEEIENGKQAYIVCPAVHKTNTLGLLSVEEEEEKIKKIFKDMKVKKLHGKLKQSEKDQIMSDFQNKDIDILITTTVVEVGVDVPNATVMIIENAERFGLAQLHQLRGRIGRSKDKAYCFASMKKESEGVRNRLEIFRDTSSGFELAEKDHKLRGSGELYGDGQSGFSDIAMEALKNPKLVEFARKEANATLKENPDFVKDIYENIKPYIHHFE